MHKQPLEIKTHVLLLSVTDNRIADSGACEIAMAIKKMKNLTKLGLDSECQSAWNAKS